MADFQANFQPVQQYNPFQTMQGEQQLQQARQIAQNEFARFQAQLAFEQAKQDWYQQNLGAAQTEAQRAEAGKTRVETGLMPAESVARVGLQQAETGRTQEATRLMEPEQRAAIFREALQAGFPGAAGLQFGNVLMGTPQGAAAAITPPAPAQGNPNLFGPGALFGSGAQQAVATPPLPQVSAINPLSGVGAQGPATAAMLPSPIQTGQQLQGAPQGQPQAAAQAPAGPIDWMNQQSPMFQMMQAYRMGIMGARQMTGEAALERADAYTRSVNGHIDFNNQRLGIMKSDEQRKERGDASRAWLRQQQVLLGKERNNIANRRANIAEQNTKLRAQQIGQGNKLVDQYQSDITDLQNKKDMLIGEATEAQKALAASGFDPNNPQAAILNPEGAKSYYRNIGVVEGNRATIAQLDQRIIASRAEMGRVQGLMMQPGGQTATTPSGTSSTSRTAAAARAATTQPRQRPPAMSPGQAIGARFLQRALQHR